MRKFYITFPYGHRNIYGEQLNGYYEVIAINASEAKEKFLTGVNGLNHENLVFDITRKLGPEQVNLLGTI